MREASIFRMAFAFIFLRLCFHGHSSHDWFRCCRNCNKISYNALFIGCSFIFAIRSFRVLFLNDGNKTFYRIKQLFGYILCRFMCSEEDELSRAIALMMNSCKDWFFYYCFIWQPSNKKIIEVNVVFLHSITSDSNSQSQGLFQPPKMFESLSSNVASAFKPWIIC